ncbi:glycosyltransferase [Fimbriimonas ginsengisoli]|uniref:4,4'-diaponeurosporenoate glycosyltransferase n=1 Tax=Fimbriimonas ginsengisoli Gsoil 348 TaxID=661478 RepID=A0A068NJ73_FIMGI|nr:glycosyltransferase family 2 protein [Fimbriimonas ginsengisoli]AIE83648.1 glycosyl transferase, group 2 family protein [Fimbriimonas ginsengisoli Gsoil 348]
MAVALAIFYGLFAFVAVTNLLLMRRPGRRPDGPEIAVLIPARNEAENLRELLPLLVGKAKVYVFDDESDDGTGEVAATLGAVVIRPKETLPKGWTGKNRACHELGKAATEDWFLFLDADVRPTPDFLDAVRDLIAKTGDGCGVITGFPTIVPGRGIEPLFLAWVGWILLSTNPFGIVSRTHSGHNRFTNGQFHVWRRDVYTRLWPNEAAKGHIMEDVMMGRLLAKAGIPVEVANVSKFLRVKMYETWRETLDGMSKNSFEVANNAAGSYGLALFMLFIGWGWLLAPASYILFVLSGLACAALVRAKPLGYAILIFTMPLALTIGAYTMVRSIVWRRRGTVVWKGRTY